MQWQFVCRYDTHTAQEPGSQLYGVVRWRACSSFMSAPLSAEGGCESCEGIVLLLVCIA